MGRRTVEQPQHNFLAETAGKAADPEIHGALAEAPSDASILGLPPFGDVQVSHDFEARGHGWDQSAGKRLAIALQHAVLAETHLEPNLLGLHMDVAGSELQGLQQDPVHQIHHW